jgi:hypothetical protein
MVRMNGVALGSIDSWIAERGAPFVTRPEAIRRLIMIALESE